MVALSIHMHFTVLLCSTGVSGLYFCYKDDGNDSNSVFCLYNCCGKPTANSTETNLLPCCLNPEPDDDEAFPLRTGVAIVVFTIVFSLVFLGCMCLCAQRNLSRARNARERRRQQSRYQTNQFIMSVRDIRQSQRRSNNFVIATLEDIYSVHYDDFDNSDEDEEARIPKPADIDKQLPSYDDAIKFGIKGSPPPYDYESYKLQTSTASGGRLGNQPLNFDSRNEIQIEPSSLPYVNNALPTTHNPEVPAHVHNLEPAQLTQNCSDSAGFDANAQINISNNVLDNESNPPPYQ